MTNKTTSMLAIHHKKADEWFKHQIEFRQIYTDCLIDLMTCPADMFQEMEHVFLFTEQSFYAHQFHGVRNLFTVVLN